MAELKTQKNDASVADYLSRVEPAKRREDAQKLYKLFAEVTGEEGSMWGDSIVGFGSYHYKYASGREGDWMRTGFSARKANLSLYIMNGFSEYDELLSQLGKYKTAKSCLYITRLDNVDLSVLRQIIHHSFHEARLGTDNQ